MDITNPRALILLSSRIIAVLAVAIFVLPINIRELRRHQSSRALYALRWVLLILSVLYILPSVFPIWNGVVTLSTYPPSGLNQIAAVWQAVREVSIGAMIVFIYYISSLLSKRQ